MLTIRDFRPRERIRIHPACDWFMRGATHARVVSVGRTRLKVQLEIGGADVGRPVSLSPDDVLDFA
ncbi:hypothetical protein [Methylobacterium ajmalii]|uniref:hypothetical protein n=1 Tax=Methylobacterium ajmalii TaxID=2738439 RepID=UPI002F35B2EA